MENLQLILNRDITKADHRWLDRDFKKNETVFLYNGYTYNCIGNDGLACSLDGMEPFFELPITSLDVFYSGNQYGIFITERSMGSFKIYCKKSPVDRSKLLDEIQNPVNESPKDKVLKFTISPKDVLSETIFLKDIEPLF
jgi:hypothetical protein